MMATIDASYKAGECVKKTSKGSQRIHTGLFFYHVILADFFCRVVYTTKPCGYDHTLSNFY